MLCCFFLSQHNFAGEPSSGANMIALSLIYMAHRSHRTLANHLLLYQLIVVCPSFPERVMWIQRADSTSQSLAADADAKALQIDF